MYKFVLCTRYLRTRFIALASIVSVMLGVATMIVVNSVMSGFSHEMQGRIHGILSDLVCESHSLTGFPDPEERMNEIRRVAGPYIAGMTPTVVVPALLEFQVYGQPITKPVNLIGIDAKSHDQVSDFARYLQHPENRKHLSFDLRESGYDTRDHQTASATDDRPEMKYAGWHVRRMFAEQLKLARAAKKQEDAGPAINANDHFAHRPASPDAKDARQGEDFDPAKEQFAGTVVGIGLINYRNRAGGNSFMVLPGQDVTLTVPTVGSTPKASQTMFTVVDVYESKMSEYDAGFVFVPLRTLQEMRGMIDPTSQVGYVTSIQIKLKNEADGDLVRDKLREAFNPRVFSIQTWRDKQGPLLAAVQMETGILNVLLFLIIAVAGFGILAIFYMIVVEKTRDIGVLKSLGATGRGIMGIFLSYGLSLGIVGSGVGMVIGLLFVKYINEIADLLGMITGHQVFDPSIYYFQKIPTIVEPLTVAWIVSGAMIIAVLASVLPARRAARLHPVEALRYE